jgi:hypothetical protein
MRSVVEPDVSFAIVPFALKVHTERRSTPEQPTDRFVEFTHTQPCLNRVIKHAAPQAVYSTLML